MTARKPTKAKGAMQSAPTPELLKPGASASPMPYVITDPTVLAGNGPDDIDIAELEKMIADAQVADQRAEYIWIALFDESMTRLGREKVLEAHPVNSMVLAKLLNKAFLLEEESQKKLAETLTRRQTDDRMGKKEYTRKVNLVNRNIWIIQQVGRDIIDHVGSGEDLAAGTIARCREVSEELKDFHYGKKKPLPDALAKAKPLWIGEDQIQNIWNDRDSWIALARSLKGN